MSYPSVQLFVDRARAARSSFALTAENAGAVATLCDRLDGLPLAIELAAARVEALGVAQLLDRLEDRFALLTGGDRLAPGRQRSLAATAEWSYRLLDNQVIVPAAEHWGLCYRIGTITHSGSTSSFRSK